MNDMALSMQSCKYIHVYIWTCIHVNERCRKKEERSKQGHMALSVHSCKYMDIYMYMYMYMLMKDAEGRKKQARPYE